MSTLSPKELIKLANACRKAGIKHYKNGDFEFTLSDVLPQRQVNKSKNISQSSQLDEFTTDSLTEEQMLMWSVGDLAMSEGSPT